FKVVAINIQPQYSLEEWRGFWRSTGAGDVLWAQDVRGEAAQRYRLLFLGTEVIVDRQGRIAFRSDGPSGYDELRSKVEEVL
ncbi:MAG: hypothetical protein HY680_11865, partial [Chloroflexi bacterium]|nr:hypothetical protein [Chloroflexota bacterium]